MEIYGSKLSPFVMRPVLAARAKGHDVDPRDFAGGIKSDAYLALTPMGKMPLLVDGDFALPESQTITDYLDHVLDGPDLAPADPKLAARTRLIVRIADLYLVPHLRGLFEAREKPEGLAPALVEIGKALDYIEHFRDAADEFVVGGSFTVADAALIPLLFFFDALDQGTGSAALIAARPGLASWWVRAKASALGARCHADQGAALQAMFAAR